jgi:hypothetical protein
MDAVRVNYWTEAEDETLRRLVISGLSYTAIGERMGRNKNSVISRSKRQGFAKLSPSKPPWNKGLTRYPDRPKKEPSASRNPAPSVSPSFLLPSSFQCVAVEHPEGMQPIGFFDLRHNSCRFPIGDDPAEMTFCGMEAPVGSSWCTHHRAIVFIPYAPRKLSVYRGDR